MNDNDVTTGNELINYLQQKISEQQIRSKKQKLSEQEETISVKTQMISEPEEIISVKKQKLSEKEETISGQKQKVAQQEKILSYKKQLIKNQKHEICSIGKKLYEEKDDNCKKEQGIERLYKHVDSLISTHNMTLREITSEGTSFSAGSHTLSLNELHATEANHKLSKQESQYVIDQLLPSVACIKTPGLTGTGFVLGSITTGTQISRYMLTVHHLKLHEAFMNNQTCYAEFGTDQNTFTVKILPPVLFSSENLDYALVKLTQSPQLDTHLRNKISLSNITTRYEPGPKSALVLVKNEKEIDWGAWSISFEDPNVKQSIGTLDDINIIRERQNRPNKIYKLNNKFTYYHSGCNKGSSGSPVFSAPKKLLYAMHCGSVTKDRSDLEYGVLLSQVFYDCLDQIAKGATGRLTRRELERLFPNLPQSIATNYLPQKLFKSYAKTNSSYPVHDAARDGHLQILQYFHSQGASLTITDDDGYTPLHTACLNNHFSTVKWLVEQSEVDVNTRDEDGSYPVHAAASGGHLQILQYLHSAGASLTVTDWRGQTPLYVACECIHLHIAKWLLMQPEVDVNTQDEDGETPLHRAIDHHFEI